MSDKKSKKGRPTKYKPEYCDMMLEHFTATPLYITVKEQKMSASGAIKDLEVQKPNAMPTFEAFSRKIGVIHETLREWCKVHENFSAAYEQCKGVQKEFIFHHGMNNGYNAGFTKFVAINCLDMKDSSHNIHDVSDDTKKFVTLAYNLEG